ncbi:MAG: LiaF-related protein [Ornithinimicrobium sp.]|uniref:LiaF domain-containing protein n=1 Tax=Ornithinimicrobium sp. TaxID=1977084 RepID=UPI0026DF79BB|nr:LiaF domain-containing protein [Ornithinimicrobium sp.]MDO5739037.1 LiaF-related protein [Ornithinimicrobium sp.]
MTIPPPLPGPQTPGEGLPEVVPPSSSALPQVRREGGDPLVSLMGDVVRTGRWDAAQRTVVYEAMGNVKLDLREVLLPGETLEVVAYALMGDVRVVVPPGTDVQVRGVTLVGNGRTESDVGSQGAAPNGSRVVVTAYTFMGNVRVRTMGVSSDKPPMGWRWARAKG